MKRFLCIILCFVFIMTLSACQSDVDKKRDELWKEIAKPAMVEHLKDKYDIDVDLQNLFVCFERDSQFEPAITSPSIPYVTANFEYNGDTYYICANVSNNDAPICYDNFQEDEIQNIIKEHINTIVGSTAITMDIEVFDLFDKRQHVEDHLGPKNCNLINIKVESFEDIVNNADDIYCTIYAYYDSLDDLNVSVETVENLSKLYNVEIVNLKSGWNKITHSDGSYNISYDLDDIHEYIKAGSRGAGENKEPKIMIYDAYTEQKFNKTLFCSIEPILPQEYNHSIKSAVTKLFIMDKYTCYISPEDIAGYSKYNYYEIVLCKFTSDGSMEVDNFDFGYESLNNGEKCYYFNNLHGKYSEYDFWYLREKVKQ